MRLLNKVCIVTGGGNGIGRAIALKFAEEGATVIPADMNLNSAHAIAAEIEERGGKGKPAFVDVADKKSITEMTQEAVRTFGTIDVLVNNAGILHSTAVEMITEEEWDRVLAINLKGVFLCCQTVLPYFKKQRSGRIINMASNAGRDGGVSTGLAYSASKAGVIGFTRGLAKRVADDGITCNCIAPGTTNSELIKSFTPEMMQDILRSIPLHRLGEPTEIAELACYIASDLSGFMTGAVVDINGGLFIG